MAAQVKRPPFDEAYENGSGFPNPDKSFDVPSLRENMKAIGANAEIFAKQFPQYQYTNISVPGIEGLSTATIDLALYRPSADNARSWPNGRPLIYHVHGGGQVSGDLYFGFDHPMSLFEAADNIALASIEYRLAPEHPAPAGAYDAFAGLVYLVKHAKELGIDPEKIVLFGISGGAGVAASAALLSRKLDGPKCAALVLSIPMVDDRQEGSASAEQFEEGTIWPGWMDRKGWSAVLGDGDRTDPDGVRVPGRANSLADLPLTFIDIGSCESMRDQAVAFASKIWRDGGRAELHVWPGVYHGSAMFEKGVPVGKEMIRVQKAFLERVFELKKVDVGAEEKETANL